MGAGPLPRVGPADHPPRPPIPIVALDDAAMAAARARGGDELAVWLAGVTGAQRPAVSVREIAAEPSDESPLAVAEVAAAVDAGRDLAARAADDGIAVTLARGSDSTRAAALLAALVDGDPDSAPRPLRALRRLGDREIAVLCGVALGAGEQGLGCVCDGLAALAGAAVAAAIEPTLRPRVRAATHHDQAARIGLATVDARALLD